MHVFIVYCHPSHHSLTHALLESFVKGLEEAGHTHEISDLYAMGFCSDLSEAEFLRASGRDPKASLPADVLREQQKIVKADALLFFYPLWWSEVPAKLKGWFDRVYTQGFAFDYVDGQHVLPGNFKKIRKAIAVCSAGHTAEHLEETGMAEGMRKILLHDRLFGVGIEKAELLILDEPSTALDAVAVDRMLKLLGREVAERGATIFFSSHQLEEVEQLADHVGVIDHGKLIFEAGLDAIKDECRMIVAQGERLPTNKSKAMISVRSEGGCCRYGLRAGGEEFAAELAREGAKVLSVEALGLREIFLHTVGGAQ